MRWEGVKEEQVTEGEGEGKVGKTEGKKKKVVIRRRKSYHAKTVWS